MTLPIRSLRPNGHLWLRVCKPAWDDPLDASYAGTGGGRWNPPNSWPTLYLSRDVATARDQVARMLEGTFARPEDLTDDAVDLVAVTLPPDQSVLDVVDSSAAGAVGLPATYPVGDDGERVPRSVCHPIAEDAYEAGLDGVECRSAANLTHPGIEVAWWTRGRVAHTDGVRSPYGEWRTPPN